MELNKRNDDYNRHLLYFKVKVSLINIHPDGNGLSWCLTRDRMLRCYFGPCSNRSYALNFHQNQSCALQMSLLLLSGDIAINPGPNSTSNGIQSQDSVPSRASNSQNLNNVEDGEVFSTYYDVGLGEHGLSLGHSNVNYCVRRILIQSFRVITRVFRVRLYTRKN